MNELLERLRRDDPSALEELGHDLLPFVQAAVIANGFELREPSAVLQVFREEVALVKRTAEAATFARAVLTQVRAKLSSLPVSAPDTSQTEALARVRKLEPLQVNEREVVLTRFVERLPADLICRQFGLETPALTDILSRGAVLLGGPSPAGPDWSAEPSLLDPNAAPAPVFVELENVLTCLAIDVTALELQPVMVAAVPVLKPGFEPSVPQEHYPSRVETQGFVDLPSDVSKIELAPAAPRPSAPKPPRPSSSGLKRQQLDPEHTPSMPTPLRARPLLERDDNTEPQGGPISSAPQPIEVTNSDAKALPAPQVESTVSEGKALVPWNAVEQTESSGQALALPPPPVDSDITQSRGVPLKAANVFNSSAGTDQTSVDLTAVAEKSAPRTTQRVPGRYWLAAAGLCALLGTSLYVGMVRTTQTKIDRSWKLVRVVAAATDLPEGTKLTLEMLSTRAVPDFTVTASVVSPGSIAYAIGQKLEFPVQAGDPLLWSQFDPSKKNKRFDIVKRGRAYTIPVTELRSLGGNLIPNEEIDLVLMLELGTTGSGEVSKPRAITLFEKIRVLAVGGVTTLNIGRVQKRFTDLTLLLVPEEIEVVSLALRSGALTATLRNGKDPETIVRGETTLETLLSGERLKRLEQKRSRLIEVIRREKQQESNRKN